MTPRQRAIEHEHDNPRHITVGDDLGGYYCLQCPWHPDGDVEKVLSRMADPCRVTTMVGPHEFICVLPAHDDGKKADQFDRHGRPARWRRHHFKRRYPYGDH